MGGGTGEGSREAEFINEIDCQFPYSDRERALALASEGLGISTEAAFRVVYEVCNLPRSVAEDIEAHEAMRVMLNQTRHDVLARIERGLSHQLKGLVLQVARDVVDEKRMKRADQIALMRRIEPFRGQYAALQIVLGAGDPDEEWDDELDRVYDEIVAAWDRPLKGRREPPPS